MRAVEQLNMYLLLLRYAGDWIIECVFIAMQAIEQLNIKANNWKDLVTDEPFTRKDIIKIQDPTNLDKFNFANFYHLRKNLKLVNEGRHWLYFRNIFAVHLFELLRWLIQI